MNLLLIPPILVQSCHDGLRIMPDTLASVRQRDGLHLYTNGYLASNQWCSHDLSNCIDAWEHPQCPIDECTHVWLVYACFDCEDRVIVQSTPNLMVTFVATGVGGGVKSGSWCGPADWDLDGKVSEGDFNAFMDDLLAGEADHDRSGTTDSQDLFLFLTDYFAG